MYVYEYGHDCPAPNKRRVYISYLDSVQYFEPKCYRTTAYHAIMVEYLRYVKKRGFHTAAIWSCPPVGGDDYIFYCHPKHQLVPREDMLRSWYHKMLDQAKSQGIVIRTTTLYDEYFTSDGVYAVPGQRRDPTCLPYFEGDYIPGEIENIIQQLEAAGNSTTTASSQDSVMVRVGHNLRKMKDNFIVVHLRNRRFAAAVERGEDVSNWKEDSDDEMLRSKRAKISGKCSAEPDSPVKDRPLEMVASVEVANTLVVSGGDKSKTETSAVVPSNEGKMRSIRPRRQRTKLSLKAEAASTSAPLKE
jgi:E1A/CREB-binding protein